MYYGETSRNLHARSIEHYRNYENTKNSWMCKHIENDHKDENSQCEFVWNVVSSFKKPMLRQLTEAVHINNTDERNILNLKN